MWGATNRSVVKRRNRNEDQRDQSLDEITVLPVHKPHTPRAQSKEPASWKKTFCPSVFPPSSSPLVPHLVQTATEIREDGLDLYP